MDSITKLLGLKDISVNFLKEDDSFIYFQAFTSPKKVVCPCCGSAHIHIHDYRTQKVKDLPFRNKTILFFLRKRRYRCVACGKRFVEKYEFLPRYHHMTQRVFTSILKALRSSRSMKSVALEYNVSSNTVSRVFDIVSYSLNKLPCILSIDEFKGNAGGEKYQAIITDPSRHLIKDIIYSREKHALFEYFNSFKERNHVKMVIMDMWEPYKDLVKFFFPNAKIVIDKYHYVRQVYWALDRVRKRIQQGFIKDKRVFFKRSKRLFFARYDNLNDEQRQQLSFMLNQHSDLHNAWTLKELFREFQDCNNSKDGERILRQWILTAQEANIPEFKDCITAFQNWFYFILNSKDTPFTNAFTEGKNNKIKVLKRTAYGYRNFPRFRNRILHCG